SRQTSRARRCDARWRFSACCRRTSTWRRSWARTRTTATSTSCCSQCRRAARALPPAPRVPFLSAHRVPLPARAPPPSLFRSTRDSQPAASFSEAQPRCCFSPLARLSRVTPCDRDAAFVVRGAVCGRECEGGELMDLMMASGVGHAGEAAARHVVWQLLHALAHCHAHLVVHRDIKPENVLLAKSSSSSSSSAHDLPHVKLIDFGLAALLPPLPLSACPVPTPAAACPTPAAHAHGATRAAASRALHVEQQEQEQQQQPQPNSSLPATPLAPAATPPSAPPRETSLSALPPVCVALPQLHEPLWELLGSQDYLSPDVLRAKYGTPTDLFSLASLAYLLLCGRLPFSPVPRCLRTTMHAVATQQAGFTESAWGVAGEAAGVGREACVSGEGRHAVQSLMAKDSARRPTAAIMLCHPWFHDLHSLPALLTATPAASAPGSAPASPATPLDPCVPLCLLHVLALPAALKHHLQSQALQLYKDHAWVHVYAAVQCRHLLGVWPGDSRHVEQGGESESVSMSHVHKVLSLCACKSLADSFLKQVGHHSCASALRSTCPSRATISIPLLCTSLNAMPCHVKALAQGTRLISLSYVVWDRAAGAPGMAEPGVAWGGERDGWGREIPHRGEQQRAGGAEGEREATFEERVARSILVDELCGAVTPAALQSALGQFGTVRSVQLVPNLLDPRRSSGCAIVELHSRHLALKVRAQQRLPLFLLPFPALSPLPLTPPPVAS
ncbi:unnamed protein product, partial [Closterium sp. Naga37s-1]